MAFKSKAGGSELATAEGSEHFPEEWGVNAPYSLDNMSYDEVMAAVTEQEGGISTAGDGADLVDDKMDLVGTPFIVVRFSFRQGIWSEASDAFRDYVSLRIVTPDGPRILNDGSTGIRDQSVGFLVAQGCITLDGALDMGKASPNRQTMYQWESPRAPHWDTEEKFSFHFTHTPAGRPLALHARKGLRLSKYDWHGEDAETFYLN